MRKLIFAAAAALTAVLATAPPALANCPLAGKYTVVGHVNGANGNYRGVVLIDDEGDCRVRWLPPNTSEGTGVVANGVFEVHYTLSGKAGVIRYRRGGDGTLHGEFWNFDDPDTILGSEVLTPAG